MGALAIIGHHAEELEFGRLLKQFMERKKIPGFHFHEVKHSYQNGSSGYNASEAEKQAAQDEILGVMSARNPKVTIDIHTGDGDFGMCLTELISLHQHKRLESLRTAPCLYPVDNRLTNWIDGFKMPRKSSLQEQRRYPFMALEVWLNEGDTPPYREEVKFASRLIRQVSQLYK